MKITTEQLTEAIRNHQMGKSIDPQLVELGVTDFWIDSLIRAYYDYEASGRGGSSDWTGGGNPHRMMEDMERERAREWFDTVCEGLDLNPWDCRAALYNAGVRY